MGGVQPCSGPVGICEWENEVPPPSDAKTIVERPAPVKSWHSVVQEAHLTPDAKSQPKPPKDLRVKRKLLPENANEVPYSSEASTPKTRASSGSVCDVSPAASTEPGFDKEDEAELLIVEDGCMLIDFEAYGKTKTVAFRSRPTGLQFGNTVPLVVASVRPSSPASGSVEIGWVLTAVNGINTAGMDYCSVVQTLNQGLCDLPLCELASPTPSRSDSNDSNDSLVEYRTSME